MKLDLADVHALSSGGGGGGGLVFRKQWRINNNKDRGLNALGGTLCAHQRLCIYLLELQMPNKCYLTIIYILFVISVFGPI